MELPPTDRGPLLAQNASQNLFEPAPILFAQAPELPHNEVLRACRDDRLHHGDLQEASFTPPREPDFPERRCRPDLTRDRHEQDVWPFAVIRRRAYEDGGSLLARGLVGEGKRNEDDVAEFKG